MTLKALIRTLQHIALKQPNIRGVGEGNLYRDLASPSIRYDLFYVTQNNHESIEGFDTFGLNLFYISRDMNESADNALTIQSHAVEELKNILRIFCDQYDAELIGTTLFQPFVQESPDLTCGVYAICRIQVATETDCPEYYDEMEEQYNG